MRGQEVGGWGGVKGWGGSSMEAAWTSVHRRVTDPREELQLPVADYLHAGQIGLRETPSLSQQNTDRGEHENCCQRIQPCPYLVPASNSTRLLP